MYDRKTWIVLALCGVLLALGVMEQSKQAAARQVEEKAKQEQAARLKEQEKAANPEVKPTVEPVKPPSMEEEPVPPPTEEELVTLASDKVLYTFSNIGGGIKYADFKTETQVALPTVPVRINERGGGPIGGLAGADLSLLNVAYSYDEASSVPGKKVVYTGDLGNGMRVRKSFALVETGEPGEPYLLDFTMQVENTLAVPFNLKEWSVFIGDAMPLHVKELPNHTGVFWYEDDSMTFRHAGKFKGGMFSGADKSVIESEPGEKVQFAGVTNQFFATALRPKEPMDATVWAKPSTMEGKSIRAGLRLPDVTLNPSEHKDFSYRIFIGPKNNSMLRKMGDGWGDLMQYGGPVADWMLIGPVARTLNWVLNKMHFLMDGVAKKWAWGLAIIMLTIIVRIVIWPLHAKSTRTMKRMSKLQPEIAKLKEKYPDDPNKLNTEMMGLYRKFGINPLGGCLPMFVQIPIFFGFYTMLQYAVELRHQGFLWVGDLSQPDTLTHLMGIPINILPVVMAVTSFLQIRMTPKTGDPTQQKIIMFMPFMFFFFCYNFAAALALYWTTQNIFSIGQTWLMNRIPEPELVARKTKAKKPFMQRM
ncbi:MAG: membrane protein insertase YidC, partial [Akkermansiaceae bacterium]|nr:membrane protein insertase YidC [Akkermansiaceae bacterium]